MQNLRAIRPGWFGGHFRKLMEVASHSHTTAERYDEWQVTARPPQFEMSASTFPKMHVLWCLLTTCTQCGPNIKREHYFDGIQRENTCK